MKRDMDRVFGRGRGRSGTEGTHWLSVSDLMAGLMVVFLFIAIALMRSAFLERDRIREVAVAYQEGQVAIYDALVAEFEQDLPRWDAGIDQATLAFEFRSPEVLFEPGGTEIRPQFREILEDFFPRYVQTILRFQDSIEEVRVEGHTSSEWTGAADYTEAYFNNLDLSQGRTQSVLQYSYRIHGVRESRDWIKSRFAAVGHSSSRPVLSYDGQEDSERSRRVNFRVVTNAETQIRRILEDQ